MYLSPNTKYVELATQLPLFFRLPASYPGMPMTNLGLVDNWKVTTINRDNGNIRNIAPSSLEISEAGEFPTRSTIVGVHPAGTAFIKVADSSKISVGSYVRLNNVAYKVLTVNPAQHLVGLENTLIEEVEDATPVKEVLNPEYAGCYFVKITPEEIGNFMITITDTNGVFDTIEDDMSVVATLANANGTGKQRIIPRVDA